MEKEKTYGIWAVRSAASIFGHSETWCKDNGSPIEFDTMTEAESYAAKLDQGVTSNVQYYVMEKEPEPVAVNKSSPLVLDDRKPSEVTPRDESSEKRNEIAGRHLVPESDTVVSMRSAVHSNYAGMIAMLGADNRVYMGLEERYHYLGEPSAYYDNSDNTLCFVSEQPDMYYFLYGEGWAQSQKKMLEHGLTIQQYHEFARLRENVLAQFTPKREILFAGQPFQPPENYLKNAELYVEGQTGNYNMLDGHINNEPPVRPDLTYEQSYDEIRKLAPESLPTDKPSIMSRLKLVRPEHEAGQVTTIGTEREL